LHWSDFSTLELLSVIARRSEAARRLIIGSYRPVERLAREHRLRAKKEELELHQQCKELRRKVLSQRDVGAYIRMRFDDKDPARSLEQAAPMIHQRSPLATRRIAHDAQASRMFSPILSSYPRDSRHIGRGSVQREYRELFDN
jgi:hypothetical protein